MKLQELLNLKVLFDAEDGNGDGGAGGGDPAPGIEVPEYIQSYADSIEDAGQKEYISGLLKDEKGVNFLKGMINDPNADYTTKAEEFKVINPAEVDSFTKEAKAAGIPEKYARMALEGRANYLQSQRDLMSPELRALDTNISNFIASASQEEQEVYARLAENAAGRKILVEKIMGGNASGSIGGAGSGPSNGQIDKIAWKQEYDAALESGDLEKRKRMKSEALATGEEYFKVFFGQ